MWALRVVERKIAAQARPGVARGGIFGQADLLVLDGAPQALGENVVARAAATVHTDLDAGRKQQGGVLGAGEMAPLVAVPDRRRGLGQSC